MRETREICAHAGERGVMATVVNVRGSAYRRPGARMLMLESGVRLGSVSGGCLEGDLSRKAAWWTSSGKPALRAYDTSSDDDAVWEFGLGCSGVIEVLLERMEAPETIAFCEFVGQASQTRTGGLALTVIRNTEGSELQIGDRIWGLNVWQGSERLLARMGGFEKAIAEARGRKANLVAHLEDVSVFVEWFGPLPRLVVFGAGHDAQPLVEMASAAGFAVTVADGRPAYVCRERFPAAERVVLLPPSSDIAGLELNGDAMVVLMTHNYPQDIRLLRQILPVGPRYLGMLGPGKRAARVFEALGETPDMATLHAPVGLDIGAETPHAIAVSILAELHCVLAGRRGGFLRDRRGAIHSAVAEMGVNLPAPTETLTPAICEWRS